jgi:hypothetical protein
MQRFFVELIRSQKNGLRTFQTARGRARGKAPAISLGSADVQTRRPNSDVQHCLTNSVLNDRLTPTLVADLSALSASTRDLRVRAATRLVAARYLDVTPRS